MRNFIILPLFAISLIGFAGCAGEKVVPVKGTVILPDDITLRSKGTDQKESMEDSISLAFIPTPADDKITAGSARISGSDLGFTVKSGTKNGLAPGTYKVTAQLQIYAAGGGGGSGQAGDPATEMNKKFGSPSATKLSLTVTPETTNVVIDLKEGKVTATGSSK